MSPGVPISETSGLQGRGDASPNVANPAAGASGPYTPYVRPPSRGCSPGAPATVPMIGHISPAATPSTGMGCSSLQGHVVVSRQASATGYQSVNCLTPSQGGPAGIQVMSARGGIAMPPELEVFREAAATFQVPASIPSPPVRSFSGRSGSCPAHSWTPSGLSPRAEGLSASPSGTSIVVGPSAQSSSTTALLRGGSPDANARPLRKSGTSLAVAVASPPVPNPVMRQAPMFVVAPGAHFAQGPLSPRQTPPAGHGPTQTPPGAVFMSAPGMPTPVPSGMVPMHMQRLSPSASSPQVSPRVTMRMPQQQPLMVQVGGPVTTQPVVSGHPQWTIQPMPATQSLGPPRR